MPLTAALRFGRRCDRDVGWAERATMRGVAVAAVSNAALSALAWPRLANYYQPTVSRAALGMTLLVGIWFSSQVLRRIFRRRDVRLLIGVHILASLALVVAPTTGVATPGLPWTHPWMITSVCAAVLLLPGREGWPLVIVVAGLGWLIRSSTGGWSISMVEAAIAVGGAMITAWAARSATQRFAMAAAALKVAADAEASASEADARDSARAWWERLLHDKVLGALVLAERALSPTALERARLLAAEAIETMETMDTANELQREEAGNDLAESVGLDLVAGLRAAAGAHDLRIHLNARGRGAPTPVIQSVLAAADQAMRNVAEHSGTDLVWLHVSQSPTRVIVEVRDQGAGFETHRVSTSRLGVRSSIPGHMALVGGSADVESTPGAGTTVRLSWADPGARERGAPISREQRQAWWWVTLLYSGLHLVGGLVATDGLTFDLVSSLALAPWVAAMVGMHVMQGRLVLATVPWVVIAADTVLLWVTPLDGVDPWALWFLGASYPALCLPALRGRPWLTLTSGASLSVVIVSTFAAKVPEQSAAGVEYALPFLIIPAIAALYAVALGRADAQLHAALEATAGARQRLRHVLARQAVVSRSVETLSEGTLPLLHKLVVGDLITAADRSEARRVEMANRDRMVAAKVLTPALVSRLREARERGATVTLTSTSLNADDVTGEETPSRLREFREMLTVVLETAGAGDQVTARWQPTNGYAAGTITREHATDDERSLMFAVSPIV